MSTQTLKEKHAQIVEEIAQAIKQAAPDCEVVDWGKDDKSPPRPDVIIGGVGYYYDRETQRLISEAEAEEMLEGIISL